ncbi:hypothetical protein QFC22_002669 [Naganishia vaughanmartiniae]|uniref:Uncharacterized protein n=1 Tax=Naganishia vaughanmartiniae TaxID=1424756 RepID=A0ACC2XAV2_9TREE|nr:hypothetical protein QFC22_002669 [Naganishia vaughanmartiniae]
MLSSTIPISIIGTQFAMNQRPFWQPDQFVPIVGMILGNAISAIGVSMNYVQKEFVQVAPSPSRILLTPTLTVPPRPIRVATVGTRSRPTSPLAQHGSKRVALSQ